MLVQILKNIKRKTINLVFNSIRNKGVNNRLEIGYNSIMKCCKLNIQGNNNLVKFGNNCKIVGLNILILGDNNRIELGNNVVINASKENNTVMNVKNGTKIIVGDDSLFSNNIEIHTTDYHGIYDKNGNRTNYDKDIIIGKKVWIGLGCVILKGTTIQDNSVVGASSVVTGKFNKENVIIAGNPAKIIKEEISWSKEALDKLK